MAQALRFLRQRLPAQQQRQAVLLAAGSALAAAVDVASVALFIPLLLLLARPNLVQENEALNALWQGLGQPPATTFLLWLALAILLAFFLKSFMQLVVGYLQARFTFRVATQLSEEQAKKYFSKDFQYVRTQNSYVLVNNSMNIPTAFAHGILLPLFGFFAEVFVMLLILCGIGVVNLRLLLFIVVILGPVLVLSYWVVRQKVGQLGKERILKQPDTYKGLHEAFYGWVDLKLYNREEAFLQRFVGRQRHLHNLTSRIQTLNLLPRQLLELGAVLAVVLIFVYSRYFPTAEGGALIFLSTFAAAAYRLLPSFSRTIATLTTLRNYHHTLALLMEAPEQPQAAPASHREVSFRQQLQVERLSFQYADMQQPLLDDLNFTLNRGDVLGLFGESGSGKSTLLYLLLGFLRPSSGRILVDDVPLDAVPLPLWHRQVGLVKHDLFVVDGTLRENVVLTGEKEPVDEQKLHQALKQAGLQQVVSQLPQGVDTPIGEGGARLSAGQLQRVGIARALYRDVQILLFDEATNALDVETEQEVLQALQALQQLGKTIVIIAHRFSTMQVCNRILHLREGRVEREYTYRQLVKKWDSANREAAENDS